MLILAHFDPAGESAERRGPQRRKLRLEAAAAAASAIEEQVTIHDLSEEGMLLECSATLQQGEQLDLVIPEAGAAEAIVVWTSGHFYGCKFREPLSTAAVSAALLRSPAPNSPAQDPNAQAVYAALVELRDLAKVIEKITDRVDRAIDRLNTREPGAE